MMTWEETWVAASARMLRVEIREDILVVGKMILLWQNVVLCVLIVDRCEGWLLLYCKSASVL